MIKNSVYISEFAAILFYKTLKHFLSTRIKNIKVDNLHNLQILSIYILNLLTLNPQDQLLISLIFKRKNFRLST